MAILNQAIVFNVFWENAAVLAKSWLRGNLSCLRPKWKVGHVSRVKSTHADLFVEQSVYVFRFPLPCY